MNSNNNSSQTNHYPADAGASHDPGAESTETVMQRLEREATAAREARNRKYQEARMRLWRFLKRLALAVRLFFFDRVIRRASRVIVDLGRVREHKAELAASADAQAKAEDLRKSRQRAWAVFGVAFAAASLDIFVLLPNIAYSLASRFAGGENPTIWEKIAAFSVIEIAILVLLLTVKSLSYTAVHLHQRNNARNPQDYHAAKWRLRGARFARCVFIVLITCAFTLNILAEVGKLDSAREMWQMVRRSMTLEGGLVAEKEAVQSAVPLLAPQIQEGEGRDGSFLSRVPITAGISIVILALHIALLFMPPGEFRRRGAGDLTKSESERLDSKLTRALNILLLRINGKLQSAADNAQKYAAMMKRTPDVLLKELERLMGKAPAPQAPAQDVAHSADAAEVSIEAEPSMDAANSGSSPVFQPSSNGASRPGSGLVVVGSARA